MPHWRLQPLLPAGARAHHPPTVIGPCSGVSLGMLEREGQIAIAVLTSRSACDLLAHYREYRLSPPAVALYYTL